MITENDIARFRAETLGAEKLIHFNNAGSSLPPDAVRNAVIQYLEEEMTFGGYETQAKYATELEGTYSSIGNLINAQASEIALVENATVAWNAAFQSQNWKNGDVIITTQADYASNFLSYLHLKKKVDVEIKIVPTTDSSDVDLEALERMLKVGAKLLSVTHIPTNGGLTLNVEAIGEIASKYDVFYLLDACQSAGQYPLDVQKIKCDALSATGRKYMRAPRGTGFLYVKKERLPGLTPVWIDLGSATWMEKEVYEIRQDAKKFESWERSYANIMGLKTAVDYAFNIGMDNIWQRVTDLSALLRERLSALAKVQVHDVGMVKSGLVSFSVQSRSANEVKTYLNQHGINVSWTGVPNALLDMKARGLTELVRASVHYYNTEEEIDKFVELLKAI